MKQHTKFIGDRDHDLELYHSTIIGYNEGVYQCMVAIVGDSYSTDLRYLLELERALLEFVPFQFKLGRYGAEVVILGGERNRGQASVQVRVLFDTITPEQAQLVFDQEGWSTGLPPLLS